MLSGFWYATAKPQKEAWSAILQNPCTEHMAASWCRFFKDILQKEKRDFDDPS